MFSGLSAFPITPLDDRGVDAARMSALAERLAAAGVDAIGALGSTGSYAYLSPEQRAVAAQAAVAGASGVPVMVGVGALTLDEVLRNADAAQSAGASALLLSAMTYLPLTDDEVVGFVEDVARRSSVPICVYDNPGTTHVTFTDAMHERLAALPQVRSIKLPGAPAAEFAARLGALRERVPASVTLGVSGDVFARDALLGGADVWYSVVGGTFPELAVALTRAAQSGDRAAADAIALRLQPLFDLFARYSSYRVVSHLAVLLGLAEVVSVHRPVRPLSDEALAELRALLPTLTAAG